MNLETAEDMRKLVWRLHHKEDVEVLNKYIELIIYKALQGEYKVYVGPIPLKERLSLNAFGYTFEDNCKGTEDERLFWICWDRQF